MLRKAKLSLDTKHIKTVVFDELKNLMLTAQGPPPDEQEIAATMRLIATARTAFETKETIGPFSLGQAQLTDVARVRATEKHGALADTRALAFDTGTGQQADRGGMRDRH